PADGTYFADYALTFEALGANIVGGCCGTTPEHIAAMRTALDSGEHLLAPITFLEDTEEHNGDYASHQSELADKLTRGHFIVGVEMAPPRSHSLGALLTSAEMLREAGADVINVPDSPTARMRMSP